MSAATDAQLEAAELAAHDAARDATGLEDFGDPIYLEGLQAILGALRDDQGLDGDALKQAASQGPILTALSGRLYANKGFTEHPECRQAEIRRPLIVIGVPRTGTTALHQVLAQDVRFQGVESWLAHTPMVRPPRDRWEEYSEYRAARDRADADRSRLAGLHWVAADEVDETNVIVRQTCFPPNFSLRGPLPTYDEFFFGRDNTAVYQYVRDVIGLIGLSAPERPWLLKNPSDMLALEAVLAGFPDACIVCTHRDPVRSIPSVVNLLIALRAGTHRYGTDPGRIDARAVGRRELGYWKIALDRYEDAKQRHPEHFHDVWQRDLLRDPMSVVAGIYDRFGLDLSPEAAASMRRWSERRTDEPREALSYRPEDFGLSADEICELYADYRRQYGFA